MSHAPLTAGEKQELLEHLSHAIDNVDSGKWHSGGAVQRHITATVELASFEDEADE